MKVHMRSNFSKCYETVKDKRRRLMLELTLWHHLEQTESYACNGEDEYDISNSETEHRDS